MIDKEILKAWIACGTIMGFGTGKVLIAWGPRRWSQLPSSAGASPQFYFPDFFLEDEKPWCEHEQYAIVELSDLLQSLPVQPRSTASTSPWSNRCRHHFEEAFADLQSRFKVQQLAKAVPYVVENVEKEMDEPTILHALQSMLAYASSAAAYPYGFWDKNEGMLGATPEVLFEQSTPDEIYTMACAGTCSTEKGDEDLLTDQKELHEHRVVVDGIVNALKHFGTTEAGPMQILRLPRLAHLVTPIRAKMSAPRPIHELIKALHPTPALGAYPRNEGLAWLKNYQKKIDRRRYGAPAGFFLPQTGESKFYVAIRNVQWKSSRMSIAAGCGIVPGSVLDKEWAEVHLKLKAIREMLSL